MCMRICVHVHVCVCECVGACVCDSKERDRQTEALCVFVCVCFLQCGKLISLQHFPFYISYTFEIKHVKLPALHDF